MFVEVNRNRKLAPDSLSRFVGERYTIFNRDAAHRNKREHISRADARMLTPMLSQIDQLSCFRDRAYRRFYDHFRRSDKCDHGSIVIRIDVSIENGRAIHRPDRLRNQFHHLGLAAFTEVWYTLNQTVLCTLIFGL